MVLASFGHFISEEELLKKARLIDGAKIRNFSNKTIARLAQEYIPQVKKFHLKSKDLQGDFLIQMSIKKGKGYHSLLLFKSEGNAVIFHDPYKGKNQQLDSATILKLNKGTGFSLFYPTG